MEVMPDVHCVTKHLQNLASVPPQCTREGRLRNVVWRVAANKVNTAGGISTVDSTRYEHINSPTDYDTWEDGLGILFIVPKYL
jgi:hypothetical protein